MNCSVCEARFATGVKFCSDCGTEAKAPVRAKPKLRCPNCNATLTKAGRFCSDCGASVASEPSTKSRKKIGDTHFCQECYQHVPVGLGNCRNCGTALSTKAGYSPPRNATRGYQKGKNSQRAKSSKENKSTEYFSNWRILRSAYSELPIGYKSLVGGSVLFFAIGFPLALFSEITGWPQNSASAPTSTNSSSAEEVSSALRLSISESDVLCAPGWCTIFRGEYSNIGDVPVDVFEEMCLVVGGKTYSEKFGVYLSETLNPGQTLLFDADFEFDSNETATEFFIGSCSSNTKTASVKITG